MKVISSSSALGLLLLSTLFVCRPAHAQLQAEFGLLGGYSTAPFDYDGGYYYSGFIDLPLKAVEGSGVFQGEVLLGISSSDNNEETLTTVLLGEQDVTTAQREFMALFGLKYRFDVGKRFKPYLLIGPGVVVNLNNPDPLIGGQVPAPPEHVERGIPTGQGFILPVLNGAGGFAYLLVPEFSIGAEARFVLQEGRNSNFSMYALRLAFHF